MPNDINTLMSLITEINAKTPHEVTDNDIKVLIAYHRHNRAQRAAGFKTKKPERPAIDALKMLGLEAPAKQITAAPTGGAPRRF